MTERQYDKKKQKKRKDDKKTQKASSRIPMNQDERL